MEKDGGGGHGGNKRKATKQGTKRQLKIKGVRACEGKVGHRMNSSANRC